MHIQFFDDLNGSRRSRSDVRFNDLGLYIYEDRRRVAVGFNLTPFLERPSILVRVTNASGDESASLSVIEAMQPNFNLTMHLRDSGQGYPYEIEAILYYASDDGQRQVSDRLVKQFTTLAAGDQ